MVKKGTPIYQTKVTLKYTNPPIWRRILVPEDTTLLKLHDILQIVMGWQDYHLHMFTFGDQNYGDPAMDEFGDLELLPEQDYTLGELIRGEGQQFIYEYDFGDGWLHLLEVEEIAPHRGGKRYPTCVTGRRATPPEDVGGVGGYENFLEAIRDPDHPEHEAYLTWIGGQFDPEEFDLEAINARLRDMGRGRSTELLEGHGWTAPDPELATHALAAAARWTESLSAAERAAAKELPLRRDVMVLLAYLRDHRVTGTSALGNLPLKVVREVSAQFVEPPVLDTQIGDHVYPLQSESDIWPLYFRHLLASLGGLIEGGPNRRWRPTPAGAKFLDADAPAQVWVLWLTWWTQVNWAVAAPYFLEGTIVSSYVIHKVLGYLLKLEADEWIDFHLFADGLVSDTGMTCEIEDQERAQGMLRTVIEQMVVNPLADFGALEAHYEPREPLRRWRPELTRIRMTPLGRRLFEVTQRVL